MKNNNLLLILIALMPLWGSITGQTRMTSIGTDVYKGVVRIKFTEDKVANFSSIQMKSTSAGAPSVFTTGTADIDAVNQSSNVFTFKRLFPYSPKFENRHRKHDLHLWYELEFDSSIDVETMMDNYDGVDGIDIIKPVYTKQSLGATSKGIVLTPDALRKVSRVGTNSLDSDDRYPADDPKLKFQWHYENFGDIVGDEDSDIDLFGAWMLETGNDSVIVAVVDVGIDYRHEDLADAMWVNEAEANGLPNVDDDNNGYVDDIHGYNFIKDQGTIIPGAHGTHVAGTVGAITNNGIGVAGVAGGNGEHRGVRIMGLQIYSESGSSKGTELAYVYAADNGAVIAQSSWSYTAAGYYEPEVRAAIDYFYDEAGDFEGSKLKGGAHFFSAGNASTDGQFFPSAYDKVVGITATGPTSNPASYTNYNYVYDVTAPGGDFLEDSDLGQILSTLPDNTYGYMSGTSMATPHVSGVAALVVSHSTDPEFTNEDLYAAIVDLVEPFGADDIYSGYVGKMGKGHLNALNSLLENEGIAPDTVGDFRITNFTNSKVELAWQVPLDEDDFKPESYDVFLSTSVFSDADYSGAESFNLIYDGEVGDTVTATLSGIDDDTDYWIAVRALDLWGNASDLSEVLHFKTLTAPVFGLEEQQFLFRVDVNTELFADTIIKLYNSGEGVLEWTTQTYNHYSLFPSLIDSAMWFPEEDTLSAFSTLNEQVATANSTSTSPIIPGTIVETDYLDQTIYTGAIFNDSETVEPEGIYGDMNTEHRIVHATSFVVPMKYSFTLTHVESWINVTIPDAPLFLEVRTGKDLFTSELLYQRFYTPDTTGVMLARMPLERPFFLDEGQYFWLVLSHPEDEIMPIVTNYMTIDEGTSFVSVDGGNSWTDFAELTASSPQQIKIRAYSVGDDPAYTYLDPYEGEIAGHDSVDAHLYVNAEHLRNGSHRSLVNIYTNDYNFLSTSLDVNILVSGHIGTLTYEQDTHVNDLLLGKTNDIEINFENTGLGEIEIYGFDFPSAEWSSGIDSTVTLLPTAYIDYPLSFTPTTSGAKFHLIKVKTNAGDYDLNITTVTIDPAQVSFQYGIDNDTIRLSIDRGETKEISFTIENSGSTYPLDYDIYSELTPDGVNAISGILNYDYEIINDSSLWEPINEYGTEMDYWVIIAEDLGFRFPFYERTYDKADLISESSVNFSSHIDGFENLPSENMSRAAIFPLVMRYGGGSQLSPSPSYYHGFGDHYVVQADSLKEPEVDGNASIQTAFFKDGTIEVRFHTVENLDYSTAIIGLQSLAADSAIQVKMKEDSLFVLKDNDVIRFTPRESANFLSHLTVDNGRLLPNEKQSVTVTINPDSSQLVTGTYLNNIRVDANTLDGVHYIPVELTVQGVFDSLTVDTNIVEFGDVYTLVNYTDTLWVTNHSDNVTDLLDFSSTVDGVTLRGELNALAAHESRRFLIDYSPTEAGVVSGSVTLSTSEGDIVCELSANAFIIPTFSHDAHSSYHFNLDDEAQSEVFTLTNESTTTPLLYQIFGGSFVSLALDTASTSPSINIASAEDDFSFTDFLESLLPHNGMVDSSYSWEVSNDENAVQYYTDNIIVTDDAYKMDISQNGFLKVDLKFPFLFFGEYYNSIWVNENGYITVIEPEVDADPFDAYLLVKGDDIRGMIMPFWSDWTQTETEFTGLYCSNQDDKLILQWRNVFSTDEFSPGVVSFELILFDDGRFKFVYDDISSYLGLFDYTVESPDENFTFDLGIVGNDINAFGVYKDNSAIMFTPALYGKVAPGESVDITLTASPEYLIENDYSQNIVLRTNGLALSDDTILVTSSVASFESMVLTDTVDMGHCFAQSGLVFSNSFYVNNRGREDIFIKYIEEDDLDDFILQDELGYDVTRFSKGILETQQQLLPGDVILYNFEYIPFNSDTLLTTETVVYGSINVELDDGTDLDVVVKMTLQPRPVLATSAGDTTISINQNESVDYSFFIENSGFDTLDYNIKASYVGSNVVYTEPTQKPGAVFDSINYEEAVIPDSYYTNIEGVSFILFSLIQPEEDFNLTHVSLFNQIEESLDYTMRVKVFQYHQDSIYEKISADTMGTELLSAEYRFQDDIGAKWRYLALPEAQTLQADSSYWVAVYFPFETYETNVIGYETCYDEEMLSKWFFCPGSSLYYGYQFSSSNLEATWVPMIRYLSGASSEGFMEISPLTGRLSPNERKEVSIAIDGNKTSSGANTGIVNIDATNVVDAHSFRVDVNVNAKPDFVYTPSDDTLIIQEKTPYTGSYLAEDAEGDVMTYTLLDDDGLDIILTPKSEYEGLAQISFNTGWEDEGIYDVLVQVADDKGNVNIDTLTVEVYNINRTPVMTFSDNIVINIAHNEVFQMNMNDMFHDPDNDELAFQVGNGNPELYEMALLGDELVIAPIEVGTGIVMFTANDGYDNGFAGYYYYVYVIDDASVAPTLDGIVPGNSDESIIEELFTAPNPTNGKSALYFNLTEATNVSIELVDLQGRHIKTVFNSYLEAGNRYVESSLYSISSGVYFYKVRIGDSEVKTLKILKE